MRILAENDIQMKGVELDEKKGEKKSGHLCLKIGLKVVAEKKLCLGLG